MTTASAARRCRSIIFFTVLCHVQCQRVQFVREDIPLRNITTELLASDAGWTTYDVQQSVPVQFIPPTPHSQPWQLPNPQPGQDGRRTQRQAYYSKNSNFGGGAFSWSHYFTIPPVYSSTKESAYVREENMKRLKNMLEKDTVFQFLNPTGLRISIPADNINIRIVDFRFKLNEEFRGNDGGHYAPSGYKRGGLSTYDIPELQVQQGDKVYYFMSVKFIKEGTDVTVQGVLEVTRGNPHQGANLSNQIQFRPTTAPVIRPQQPSYGGGGPTPTVGGGYGGGTRGAFIWNHQFTINATYGSGLTQSAANSWLQQAEILKNSVQNIDFQFSNPTGLTISIPDSNIRMRIDDFRLKVNEEFRGNNDGGHYAPTSFKRGNLMTYNVPQLKATQGDRIFYTMRVKLGKEEFDTIVRGILTISQGDPHIGGPVAIQPAPAHLTPVQPPPVAPPISQYPDEYQPPPRPNPYPPQQPSNQYNTPPPIQNNQIPNRYPPSTPSRYPPPSPPNKYPQPAIPTQSPSQPSYNQNPSQPSYNQNPSQPSYNQNPSQPSYNQNPSQPTESCDSSLTSANMNGDTTRPCRGQILLDHKFNNLDGWTHQISIGGKNPEDEFTCFTKYDENTWIQQGRLNIKPTLLEEKYNDSYVRSGELFLPGCTLSESGVKYCIRKATGYNILPPINSARINTQNMISFRYGTVEIRAKLPQGDWIVAELWLEPTNPAVGETVVLGMATGNAGETANQMAAGVVRKTDKRLTLMSIVGSSPWYQGFHTFKLEWTPDHVKFFVDNRMIHDLPNDSFLIFSQEVYISLGVHAGGYRDFPDESFPNKPWNDTDVKRIARFWDAKREWYPTWRNDPKFQVEYIRVKAL